MFANGLALSPDESFLLVNDLGRHRILKLDLSSEQIETFAQTPGKNDNLRRTDKGTYLVGIIMPSEKDRFDLASDFILPYNNVRRAVHRILSGLLSVGKFLSENQFLPSLSGSFSYWVANTGLAVDLVPARGLIVEYDGQGRVLQTWWNSEEGKVGRFSEGFLHEGYLYLGSPYNNFASRVKYE